MSRKPIMRADLFGVRNHVGSIWSSRTFQTRADAQAYLDGEREEWRRKGWGDLSRHAVVPVKVTIKEIDK